MKELFEQYLTLKPNCDWFTDGRCKGNDIECDRFLDKTCLGYPTLTSDKVLALINCLANMCYKVSFSAIGQSHNTRAIVVEITECGVNVNKEFWLCENSFKSMEDNLAGALKQLYDCITEQEREQIKTILKG